MRPRERDLWAPTRLVGSFYPLDPSRSPISLFDLSFALAGLFRYGGHSRLTVAEHSVLLSEVVPPPLQFQALMHDAREGLLGFDLPAPIKYGIAPDQEFDAELRQAQAVFERLEQRAHAVIAAKFDLPEQLDPIVVEADRRIAVDEMLQLFGHGGNDPGVEGLGVRIYCWSPNEARRRWAARFRELRS